jgi:hypothetical membrane protein
VPWWGLVSSATAPVLLVGGWTLAAARQRGGFDQTAETISSLAGLGADDRWVMTCALAGVGLCHVATATALRPAALPGRILLAAGGVATVAVAATPLPAGDGSAPAHAVAAAGAFLALSVWPAAAARRGQGGPLRPGTAMAASLVLSGLTLWFAAELVTDGAQVGLAERAAAGAQAVWPLLVAWSMRRLVG